MLPHNVGHLLPLLHDNISAPKRSLGGVATQAGAETRWVSGFETGLGGGGAKAAPLWYSSTQAAAPQSKMFAASEPSISAVNLARGSICSAGRVLVSQVAAT